MFQALTLNNIDVGIPAKSLHENKTMFMGFPLFNVLLNNAKV